MYIQSQRRSTLRDSHVFRVRERHTIERETHTMHLTRTLARLNLKCSGRRRRGICNFF